MFKPNQIKENILSCCDEWYTKAQLNIRYCRLNFFDNGRRIKKILKAWPFDLTVRGAALDAQSYVAPKVFYVFYVHWPLVMES